MEIVFIFMSLIERQQANKGKRGAYSGAIVKRSVDVSGDRCKSCEQM